MGHDVFISYPSENKSVADAICAKLEINRIRCFIAPRDILPGQMYAEALLNAIDSAKIFILVFSKNTNSSPHIMSEVQRAFNCQLIIIPFRIENIQPSKSLEYYISSSHWLDALTPPIEKQIEKLTEVVVLNIDPRNERLREKYQSPVPSDMETEKYTSVPCDHLGPSGKSAINIFISYSPDAHDFVTKLRGMLLRNGYSSLLDSNVDSGPSIMDSVTQGPIPKSDAFIFIVSPQNVENFSIGRTELLYASHCKIPIIPVVVDKNIHLPLLLNRSQLIDITEIHAVEKNLLEALFKIANPDISGESRVNNRDKNLVEQIAKAIHGNYLTNAVHINSPTAIRWDLLPEEYRESNRQQAYAILQLLRCCGYTVQHAAKPSPVQVTFGPEEIEIMAEMEHDRWADAKIQAGWSTGSHRDDRQKIHPGLLIWDEMDESSKNMDRNIVASIPKLLSTENLEIVKIYQDK
jgi:hypothetical protein